MNTRLYIHFDSAQMKRMPAEARVAAVFVGMPPWRHHKLPLWWCLLGLAVTSSSAGDKEQRNERNDRALHCMAGRVHRERRTRQQPQDVEGEHRAGYFGVAAPAACEPLIGMAAMRLVDPLPACQAPQQGHSCID